ncbi:MAG: hypothetical protein V7K54_17445 [Nostoc sp.]
MRGIVSRHLTPVRSSRDTLSAVPPGGNPLGASLSLWEKTGLPTLLRR